MKNRDIITIVIVAIFAGVLSFVVANYVFVSSSSRQQKAAVVDNISSEMLKPDPRFFNVNSINPSRDTNLSNTNETPFNGTSQ